MILNLIKRRFSPKKFRDTQIEKVDIVDILEAGRLSPSIDNKQPWKFAVITNTELIRKIAFLSYKQEWIISAPLLIILCIEPDPDDMEGTLLQKLRFPEFKADFYKIERKIFNALNLEEHQTKIAGENMCLVAMEKGIYSTWISKFYVTKVQELLDLPEAIIPSEIIAFGYPAENENREKIKSFNEVVNWWF